MFSVIIIIVDDNIIYFLEKAVTDWKLLADVALEMRGQATILFIDCG